MNTHLTVSDIRNDVSGIRSDVSKIREEIGGQVHSVSAVYTQTIDDLAGRLHMPRRKPGQQLLLLGNMAPYICV